MTATPVAAKKTARSSGTGQTTRTKRPTAAAPKAKSATHSAKSTPLVGGGVTSDDVNGAVRVATRVVSWATDWLGSLPAILGAVFIIVIWGATGPLLKFSNTWQLIINTLTTLVTFTMVFIIQNTQNRDGRAVQTKLDAQSEALIPLCEKFGVADVASRLKELTAVEDQPEKVIEREQRQVRRAG